MTSPHLRRGEVNALGRALCDWRQKRAYSPLELALATVLDVPLREQEEGVSSLLPSSHLSCLGAEHSDKP